MKKMLSIAGVFMYLNFLAQVPTAGLMGYWPFNGNASDLSGNNNNGTVHGATPAADRFGNINSAYYLDGISNYISILNSTSLNPQNAISLCGWYKSVTFTGAGYSAFIDKGYSSHVAPYYQYKLGVGGSYANANMFAFSVELNNVEKRISTPNQYWTPGNWYFFVGTYDGSKMKFYVNNVLIQSVNQTGLINAYNSPVYFGNNTTANDFLKGTIDDMRIYDRALDTAEIRQLYNESNSVSGLVDLNSKQLFEIFPNPFNDNIFILNSNLSSNSNYRINMVNSQGALISQYFMNSQKRSIDLSEYSSGLYFVSIVNNEGTTVFVKKILKQ